MVAEGEGGRIAHLALLSNPCWVFSGRLEVEGIVRRYYSGAAQNPSEVGAPSYRPMKPLTELSRPLLAPTACASPAKISLSHVHSPCLVHYSSTARSTCVTGLLGTLIGVE